MLSETSTVLLVAKTATVVFGGVLLVAAVRASRRTNSRALRALAVGIGLLLTGAVGAGALHQFAGFPLAVSASFQSVFTAAGFAVMAASLYTGDGERTRSATRFGD